MQYYYKTQCGNYGTFYKDTDYEAIQHVKDIPEVVVLYKDGLGGQPDIVLSFLPAYIPSISHKGCIS